MTLYISTILPLNNVAECGRQDYAVYQDCVAGTIWASYADSFSNAQYASCRSLRNACAGRSQRQFGEDGEIAARRAVPTRAAGAIDGREDCEAETQKARGSIILPYPFSTRC